MKRPSAVIASVLALGTCASCLAPHARDRVDAPAVATRPIPEETVRAMHDSLSGWAGPEAQNLLADLLGAFPDPAEAARRVRAAAALRDEDAKEGGSARLWKRLESDPPPGALPDAEAQVVRLVLAAETLKASFRASEARDAFALARERVEAALACQRQARANIGGGGLSIMALGEASERVGLASEEYRRARAAMDRSVHRLGVLLGASVSSARLAALALPDELPETPALSKTEIEAARLGFARLPRLAGLDSRILTDLDKARLEAPVLREREARLRAEAKRMEAARQAAEAAASDTDSPWPLYEARKEALEAARLWLEARRRRAQNAVDETLASALLRIAGWGAGTAPDADPPSSS